MRRLGENGFTAQEVLVVGALLVIIIVPGIFLAQPKNYGAQERNAERTVAIAGVMQSIHAYVAHTGSLPSDIAKKMEPVGSATNQVNLCKDLSPEYLSILPVDPFFGSPIDCATDSQYESGLAIEKTGKGTQVTIVALGSENKQIIYLTD